MPATEKITIPIWVNFDSSWAINNVKRFARDTWDLLDNEELTELEIKVVWLEDQKREVIRQIREIERAWEDVPIELKLERNRLSRNLTEAKRELNNFLNTWDRSVSRLQRKFDWLGSWLTSRFKRIWAAIVAAFSFNEIAWFFRSATEEAAKFQQRLWDISTLISWDSTEAIEELSDWIKDLVANVPVSADDLWASAYSIVSAWISDTSDALNVLDQSARLSVAGLSTTAEATDIVTSAINAFWFSAEDADEVADILFKTVRNGKTTVSELAQSFWAAAPVLANAWVSLWEFSAATAALTTSWLPASQAQNSLRQATVSLIKPTKEMQELLQQQWFESWKAAIESLWLVWAFNLISEAADWNAETIARAVWSVEALGAVQSLTWEQSASFLQTQRDITEWANSLDEAFQKQNETFENQSQLFQNNVDLLKISLWTVLLPILNSLIEAITPVIDWFRQFSEQNPQVFEVIWQGISGFVEILIRFWEVLFNVWSILADFIWQVVDWFNTAFQAIDWTFWWPLISLFEWVKSALQWLFDFFSFVLLWIARLWENNFLWIQVITESVVSTVVWIFRWFVTTITSIIQWWLNFIWWIFSSFWSILQWDVQWFTSWISQSFWWLFQALSWIFLWWIQSIWSIFTSWLSWLANQAERWWINIIASFARGIQSRIDSIISSVKNVASTVKWYLWVQSPTDLWPLSVDQSLRWENLVRAFAEGIDKGKDLVERRLQELTTLLEEELSREELDFDVIANLRQQINELESFDSDSLDVWQAVDNAVKIYEDWIAERERLDKEARDAEKERLEEIQDAAQDVYDEIGENQEENISFAEDLTKEIEDNIKKIDDFADDIKDINDEIRDLADELNDDLLDADSWFEEKLIERASELWELQWELQNEITKAVAENNNTAAQIARNELAEVQSELNEIQNLWFAWWVNWENFISWAWAIAEAQRLSWLSETQRLLEEFERERQQIQSDNAEELSELEAERARVEEQQQLLDQENQQKADQLFERLQLIDNAAQRQIEAERKITEQYWIELNNRRALAEEYSDILSWLSDAIQESSLVPNVSWIWWSTNNDNSVNNNTTIEQVVVQVEQVTDLDSEDLFRILQQWLNNW